MQESTLGGAAVEVCEEMAFHGVEYILSISVAEGQVLLVDVEKVCLHVIMYAYI